MAYAHVHTGNAWGFLKHFNLGKIDCLSCVFTIFFVFALFTIGAIWFLCVLQPKLKKWILHLIKHIFCGKWNLFRWWRRWIKEIRRRQECKRKCIKKCIKKCDTDSSSSSCSSETETESECSEESESSCSSSSESCSSTDTDECKDKKEKCAHQKVLLHCPRRCESACSTTYTWCVPKDVHVITATIVGGGGAGGNLTIAEPLVINGTGGQAGSSIIDAPIIVRPCEQITLTVGGGGVPTPANPATLARNATTFSSLRNKARAQGLNSITPSVIGLGCTNENGTASSISTLSGTLFVAGGVSGNLECPPNIPTDGTVGQCGEPGSTVPVSGTPPPPTPGKVYGQGGNSPFARGGIPVPSPVIPCFNTNGAPGLNAANINRVNGTTDGTWLLDPEADQYSNAYEAFKNIDAECLSEIPCRRTLFERDPNGSLGSGGAGQTLTSAPGKGGDGFIILRW